MKNFKLEVNTRLDILKDDSKFKSVIQDVEKDFFCISIPINNGEYMTFRNNEYIEMVYYKDESYLYKLTCNVIGTTKDNNIPMYKISNPKEIVKVQRRNFVRVNITKKTSYVKGEYSGIRGEQFLPALLLDLSGGGMRVKIKEELKYGDLITVKVNCGESDLYLKAKIVRKEKSIDGRYIYGSEFWEVDNNLREKVIQEIFSIMRKQRELV